MYDWIGISYMMLPLLLDSKLWTPHLISQCALVSSTLIEASSAFCWKELRWRRRCSSKGQHQCMYMCIYTTIMWLTSSTCSVTHLVNECWREYTYSVWLENITQSLQPDTWTNKVNKAISSKTYFVNVPQGSQHCFPMFIKACTDCTVCKGSWVHVTKSLQRYITIWVNSELRKLLYQSHKLHAMFFRWYTVCTCM